MNAPLQRKLFVALSGDCPSRSGGDWWFRARILSRTFRLQLPKGIIKLNLVALVVLLHCSVAALDEVMHGWYPAFCGAAVLRKRALCASSWRKGLKEKTKKKPQFFSWIEGREMMKWYVPSASYLTAESWSGPPFLLSCDTFPPFLWYSPVLPNRIPFH